MRILDALDNEIFTYNKNTHYLIEDTILVAHHDEIQAVEEQGHYKVIAEYPNGGKDVEWVIDVPGVLHQDAWDEFENILRLVEFKPEELLDLDLMEALRHKSEKTPTPEVDRVAELEKEIAELKLLINSLVKGE